MRAVRFVGARGCTSPRYAAATSAGTDAVIDTVSKAPNVTLQFTRDGRPMTLGFTPAARDLLDLAVTIYVADELEARAGAADGWTRRFEFLVPVVDPTRWRAAEARLADVVRTLAGDRVSFEWEERAALGPIGRHRRRVPGGFDVVCLFSGGIDSTLGALDLLRAGRRVLLVGHQAEGTTAAAQTRVADRLRAQFGSAVALVQCRVARSPRRAPRFALPPKREDSHRPRSLLFLSLGVAIAVAARATTVTIPENGLIALNAPLQRSRVGTLSTRTAHPKFLWLLREFVRQVGAFGGTIRNPFLYASKTDMLATLDEPARRLLPLTVSCAHAGHVRWEGVSNVRHCGYCVPCLYRRAAMAAADLDRRDEYVHDAFGSLRELTPQKQLDFRALARFAREVAAMTPAARQMLVMAHGAFPPSVGAVLGPRPAADYSPWADMLARWAAHFVRLVETRSSAATRRVLSW